MSRKKLLSDLGVPYVSNITLEEYADWYKDYAIITRDELGVCTIRLHTDGGHAVVDAGMHKAIPDILKYVGMDPHNELVIVTGTGDFLFGPLEAKTHAALMKWAVESPLEIGKHLFDIWPDAAGINANIVFDINVPTIGVINGPSHAGLISICTYCDVTLAADDAFTSESHFLRNVVPGDGLFNCYQMFLGDKRANHLAYMGDPVSAQQAKEWGMVNEVHPRENLLSRAYEIAGHIMKRDRRVRRMTHAAMRQRLIRHLAEDMLLQLALEGWAGALTSIDMYENRKAGKSEVEVKFSNHGPNDK